MVSLFALWLPQMASHIDMTIRQESDSLLLQQFTLTAPTWRRPSSDVHHPMARQLLGTWRIAQRTPHHPGVAWPSRPCSNHPIGGDPACRYLSDNVQHIVAKCPCLLRSHLVWIVIHRRRFHYNLSLRIHFSIFLLQRYEKKRSKQADFVSDNFCSALNLVFSLKFRIFATR